MSHHLRVYMTYWLWSNVDETFQVIVVTWLALFHVVGKVSALESASLCDNLILLLDVPVEFLEIRYGGLILFRKSDNGDNILLSLTPWKNRNNDTYYYIEPKILFHVDLLEWILLYTTLLPAISNQFSILLFFGIFRKLKNA